MPAGFEVVGNVGNFQVVDNFPALYWKEKRNLVAPFTGSAFPPVQILTIIASERAAFVLHSTQAGCAVGFGTYSAGQWQLYVYSSAPSATDVNFELHIFDAFPAPKPGPGLQVFDTLGRLTWDSNNRPLEITAATIAKWGWVTNRVGQMGVYYSDTPGFWRRFIELCACNGQVLKRDYRQFGIATIPPEDYMGDGIYLTKVNLVGL